jgi:hypothetical protein
MGILCKVSGALLLMAVLGGYLVHRGMFYPTGTQYYEVCWDKRTKTNAGGRAHGAIHTWTSFGATVKRLPGERCSMPGCYLLESRITTKTRAL